MSKNRKKATAPVPVPEPDAPRSVWDKIQAGYYRTNKPYPPFKLRSAPEAEAAEHKRMRSEYTEDQVRLDTEFKADLLAFYEVTDNPKANRAFSIAWEHGHASGYNDVACFFADIVELIK